MKIFLHLILFIFIINCSLNSESKYWTEDTIKKKTENKKLIEIIGKSNDIRSIMLNAGGPTADRTIYPIIDKNYDDLGLTVAVSPSQITVDSILITQKMVFSQKNLEH